MRYWSGDCHVDQLRAGKFPGGHPGARNTIVAANKCREVELGRPGTGKETYYKKQHVAATNTTLGSNDANDVKNTGKVKGTKTDDRYVSSYRRPVRAIAARDVGPNAEDKGNNKVPQLEPTPKPELTLEQRVSRLEERVTTLEE